MTNVSVPRITPFLWFDNNAEEAVRFYTSVFENSRVIRLGPMVSTFELDGQRFMALNGGPHFKFTEAVSFYVNCDTQKEVDHYWEKLSAGGDEKAQQCGWLKDKYGLSWQIVPKVLGRMLQHKDARKSERVMRALLQMKKLNIKRLKKAYGQRSKP